MWSIIKGCGQLLKGVVHKGRGQLLKGVVVGCVSLCFFLLSSSIVTKSLVDAHKQGVKFKVIVVDSRPKLEGMYTCDMCCLVYINVVHIVHVLYMMILIIIIIIIIINIPIIIILNILIAC